MNMSIPKIILGTSSLGNLYQALSQETKTAIIKEFILHSDGQPFFDTAGKYGAGLALESLGIGLKQSGVSPDDVIISNKLGWIRTELKTPEPTFEPGVWKDLKFDAVQKMGYDGILECFEQGNQLLNGYNSQFVSVHDPDEFLAASVDKTEEAFRYKEILSAYDALFDLKKEGKVMAVGVGAKDWRVIERLAVDINFDWVMIANSMTIHSHPPELVSFMNKLKTKGVRIINSAVFNGGFLTGGDFYNYKPVERGTALGDELLSWRDQFFNVCKIFGIKPPAAAMQFGMAVPGVTSIAISSTSPKRIQENIAMVKTSLPREFWQQMLDKRLIQREVFETISSNLAVGN